MKNEVIASLCFGAVLAVSAPAFALELDEEMLLSTEPRPAPRVLAAEGPGLGRGAWSLGLSLVGATPTVDLRYARGLGERITIDASVATIGVLQKARLGGRYLLLDGEDGALAIRASVQELHDFPNNQLIFGAGPGLVYSFGNRDARFTVQVDLAWSFLSSSAINPFGGALQVQPAVGVELTIDEQLEAFLEAGVHAAVERQEIQTLPCLSAGIAW